jgi:hypothetical protein
MRGIQHRLMENLGNHCFRGLLLGGVAAKKRAKIGEPIMSTKFVAAIAVMTAFTATVAFAQTQAAPKVSQAEVQKLVDGIKGDNAKLSQFCGMTKLAGEAGTLAQQNPNDPKIEELGKQMDEMATKLGPDFEKITNSDMDDASAALLDGVAKSCK